MRTIQEVFTQLIEDITYQDSGYFMCVALIHALEFDLITEEEAQVCNAAIHSFIGENNSTLHSLFAPYGWPDYDYPDTVLTEKVRLKIYQNWEGRHQIFKEFVNDPVSIGARDKYIIDNCM